LFAGGKFAASSFLARITGSLVFGVLTAVGRTFLAIFSTAEPTFLSVFSVTVLAFEARSPAGALSEFEALSLGFSVSEGRTAMSGRRGGSVRRAGFGSSATE